MTPERNDELRTFAQQCYMEGMRFAIAEALPAAIADLRDQFMAITTEALPAIIAATTEKQVLEVVGPLAERLGSITIKLPKVALPTTRAHELLDDLLLSVRSYAAQSRRAVAAIEELRAAPPQRQVEMMVQQAKAESAARELLLQAIARFES